MCNIGWTTSGGLVSVDVDGVHLDIEEFAVESVFSLQEDFYLVEIMRLRCACCNPKLVEASDRAHRLGQNRPVTIYRLVAENTIEKKIIALHAQKRDLADSLLEGSDMSGKLSLKEIMGLIAN